MKTKFQHIHAEELIGSESWSIRENVTNAPIGKVTVRDGKPSYYQYWQAEATVEQVVEIGAFMVQFLEQKEGAV